MLRLTGLFIWPVSDILLSPSTPWADSAYSLTWKWPRRDGSRPLFTKKVNTNCPTHHSSNSKHMGQVWAYYPFSDKNNNWLICSCIAELSVKTVGGILAKINMADSNSKYTYQVKWWKLVEKSLLTFCNVLLLLHGYYLRTFCKE